MAKTKYLMLAVAVILIISAIYGFGTLKPKQTTEVNMEKVKIEGKTEADKSRIAAKELKYPVYAELTGTQEQFNTDKEIKLSDYIGKKVILIDFWTYSCINCQRTLPYITMWDDKYRDDGLLIVGIHTPEFEFEKDPANVHRAIEKWGIKYPVVQDNNFATWNAYGNRYWPRKYIIDIDGFIVYDHAGEGAYDEAEGVIQELLKERADVLNEVTNISTEMSAPRAVDSVEFSMVKTPEIYFGYQFYRGNFGNPEGLQAGKTIEYELPSKFAENQAYFSGLWKTTKDYSELMSDTGEVVLKFSAKDANIVAESTNGSQTTVYVDDKIVDSSNKGKDVNSAGLLNVKASDLYNVVSASDYGTYTLRLKVSKGFRMYTFTFG